MDELIIRANLERFKGELKRARSVERRRALLNLIQMERHLLRHSAVKTARPNICEKGRVAST